MSTGQNRQITALLEKIKPASSQLPANSPLSSKAQAEQWVSHLSPNNAAATAVELYKALPQMVALNIEPSAKKEILEIIYPVVERCSEALLHIHINQDTAKAVSLAQALMKQLYEGWKSLTYHFGQASTETDASSKEVLTQCIQRACHTLAHIQLNSLSLYLQQPGFFWKDLHTLYLLARKLEIHNDVMSDSLAAGMSIQTLYVKLLLLSCTRPNHFSSYELKFVYSELDFWASLAELRKGASGGLFMVDPHSNQAPFYTDEGSPHSETLILDTSKLVSFLKDIISEHSNRNLFSDRISQRVIQDLITQWGEKIKRKETHLKDNAKVMLSSGFTSSVCMLSKTDSFDNFLTLCGEKDNSFTVKSEDKKHADSSDVWKQAYDVTLSENSHPEEPITYTPTEKKKTTLTLFRGIRVNTSLKGACVELIEGQNDSINPGEPIALRTKDSNSWTAGIIRWKHITPTLNTVCGIHFPAKHSIPAAVRGFKRGKNSDQRFLQSIILSKKEDLSGELSILCPPLRFSEGAKVHLLTVSKKYTAILTEQIETTENLAHFKLELCQ